MARKSKQFKQNNFTSNVINDQSGSPRGDQIKRNQSKSIKLQAIARKSKQNGFKSNVINENQAIPIDSKEIQAKWLQIKRNQ